MNEDVRLVVPVLHFIDVDGRLDRLLTRAYIRRATETWIDRFLLCGATANGGELTPGERLEVLDLWLEETEASRLYHCCWGADDVLATLKKHVRPVAVLRGSWTFEAVRNWISSLPSQTIIYSNPRLTSVVFDAELAEALRISGALPFGAKVSKVSLPHLQELRIATGPHFELLHGSARDIIGSLRSGASGVVSAPLCFIPDPFPGRSVAEIQEAVLDIQKELDRITDREDRSRWYRTHARRLIA
jgi:dihydrodipicolinate synthase/N-acetylneuraminate lyase